MRADRTSWSKARAPASCCKACSLQASAPPTTWIKSLLEGRYCEIRMLFYVGKDLVRWIEQSLEHVERHPGFRDSGIKFQSFAAYLVNNTPSAVQAKLRKWGVADFKSIFMRAIGLNAILASVPEPRHPGRRFRPELLSVRRFDFSLPPEPDAVHRHFAYEFRLRYLRLGANIRGCWSGSGPRSRI